jgi:hypothetical protein
VLPDAVAEALALIETIAPLASHELSFDRDATDSFALKLERLREGAGAGAGKARRDVPKDDLLPLLPQGSRWNPAVGWRSFVVLPFERPGICAAAVGVEAVVPHASRGAFPIMRAFLMPAENISPALCRLASGLPSPDRSPELLDRRGVIRISNARSPGEHEQHEGLMLRAAAESWRFGEPRLLRTLMLSDDQAPWPRHWSETLREMTHDTSRPPYLIATVPAIRAQFSRSTRLTLWRKEILR